MVLAHPLQHTMKPNFASYLRHVFTTGISALVIYLTASLALGPEQVGEVTAGLKQMGEGLVVVLLVIAPILGRLVWAWFSQVFQRGSGEGDSAGGLGLLMLGCMAAGLLGGLPSCSHLEGVPIRIGIETPEAVIGYSSKGGLSVSGRVRGEK